MTLSIQEQFGQIDIYVFDQILRGNIAPGMCVLDAGCGFGRNLVYLLRAGCKVFALDEDAEAVAHVRQLSASLETGLPEENFQVGSVERLPFPDGIADVVLSQRGASLCSRRAALPGHAGRALAGGQAGRDALLPAGLEDWNGLPTAAGQCLPDSRRIRVVPRGRSRCCWA